MASGFTKVEDIGPVAWNYLHRWALSYPTHPNAVDKRESVRFLRAMAQTFPCSICRSHFLTYLTTTPADTANRDALFRWTVDFHNEVNYRTGKIIQYTTEQAYQQYSSSETTPEPVLPSTNPTLTETQAFSASSFLLAGITVGACIFLYRSLCVKPVIK
jgi:hypothetical protein